MKIVVATRKSRLAQAQADYIIELLEEQDIHGEKLLIQTLGDKRLDVSIDKIGGKGVFVKDIEKALLDGRSDCAVHSMKDMPSEIHRDFILGAIPKREDVRDVLVGEIPFKELRKNAVIGTSSNRRQAQIKELRPDIEIVPIRGNIETRISKIEKENLDGIVLAAAGLIRLGLEYKIIDYFDPYKFIPAVGQGALGVQTLKNSKYLKNIIKLDDIEERIKVDAERSFMKKLNGSCHVPIGAYSLIDRGKLYMVGIYEVGGRLIKKDIEGDMNDNIQLGEKLAIKIIEDM